MYLVNKGFSGIISAHKGQVIEIKDKKIAEDLMNAGYIQVNSEKIQNLNEAKKQIETLTKESDVLKNQKDELVKEIDLLKEQLSNIDLANKEVKETSESTNLDSTNENLEPDKNDKDDSQENDPSVSAE